MARSAFVDPPLRAERIEVPYKLGLVDGVACCLDPDVRSPVLIVPSRPEQEPGHVSVAERDSAGHLLLRPQRRHLFARRGRILEALREQRLRGSVLPVPARQKSRRRIEMVVRERAKLGPAHRASSGHGSRTGVWSPGQSAYASSGSYVSFAADASYFAATSLTG